MWGAERLPKRGAWWQSPPVEEVFVEYVFFSVSLSFWAGPFVKIYQFDSLDLVLLQK